MGRIQEWELQEISRQQKLKTYEKDNESVYDVGLDKRKTVL